MNDRIFFDLDGTLTNPRVGITNCIQSALRRLGREVPPTDDLLWCIGPPLLESFAILTSEAEAQQALVYYRDRFADVGWRENEVYDGVPAMLQTCRDLGVPMNVATSKPHIYANQILEFFGLREYFANVYGAELDGTRSNKTQLLAYALHRDACDSGIMVGDRLHDMSAGVSCGLTTIAVTYGFGSREELVTAGALFLADTPNEVAALVRDLRPPVD